MNDQGSDVPEDKPKERVPTWLLIVGWIFALLGGLIGIFIAASIAFGERYDDVSHKKGLAMFITALVLMALGITTCIVRRSMSTI